MEIPKKLCLKLGTVIVYGKSSCRSSENIKPVVYFPFFSWLCRKNWQVALMTGKAMSSASDNVIDTDANDTGFLTVQDG